MLDKIARKEFMERMKTLLLINNYGFQEMNSNKTTIEKNERFQLAEAKNLPAIRELMVRLAVWTETGYEDEGTIDYPEARRQIVYHLDSKDIAKCKIHLIHLS